MHLHIQWEKVWEISSHAVSHVTSGKQNAVTQGAVLKNLFTWGCVDQFRVYSSKCIVQPFKRLDFDKKHDLEAERVSRLLIEQSLPCAYHLSS